ARPRTMLTRRRPCPLAMNTGLKRSSLDAASRTRSQQLAGFRWPRVVPAGRTPWALAAPPSTACEGHWLRLRRQPARATSRASLGYPRGPLAATPTAARALPLLARRGGGRAFTARMRGSLAARANARRLPSLATRACCSPDYPAGRTSSVPGRCCCWLHARMVGRILGYSRQRQLAATLVMVCG
ncbi:hypothetical protein Dimus_001985, partial [Dionaea muscipula]